MGAGSLEKPEQFVVVDDHTVRVDFLRKDRLTLPDLAVIVPRALNSALVQQHVTEQDPWGLEYTKQNTAGGGAYKVAEWSAGTEVVYERNEDWKGGPLPKIKRIIWRMVPSSGNRRALLERGDADISYDLPNKDFVELRDAGKLTIVSTPLLIYTELNNPEHAGFLRVWRAALTLILVVAAVYLVAAAANRVITIRRR